MQRNPQCLSNPQRSEFGTTTAAGKMKRKIPKRRETDGGAPNSVHKFCPDLWLTTMYAWDGLQGAQLSLQESRLLSSLFHVAFPF